ncbi:hypothetical protein [Saccharothrix luteola]|uniref:hypothetical protein n=1 Tax=Saccharothrix luteola TaxID=2893018 RepID=UPI001E5C9101|nr:hypothetical protein [Saccharothrix luteola]MCC8251525.1 hypothetical protein [Saccharothrix luteola]
MRAVTAVVGRIEGAVAVFEPRGWQLACARSALAAAQVLVLLANPDEVIFAGGPVCSGVGAIALWCLVEPAESPAADAVALLVLAVVLSGFRPRWTCVPHWYLAFGFAAACPVANGGDRIAQLATMLLVPLCLGDDRTWQWSRPRAALSPGWRGAAFAGHLALRLQVAVVYGYAVVAKFGDPLWRDGRALSVVLTDPNYGAPWPVLSDLVPAPALVGATWLVIATQAVIAVGVLWRPGVAVVAAGVVLHVVIAAVLNLQAFGLVMAGVLAACLVRAEDRRNSGGRIPVRRRAVRPIGGDRRGL